MNITRIATRVLIQRYDAELKKRLYLVIWVEKANGVIVPDLPGGGLEIKESLHECAIREVKEETNLDIYNPTFMKYVECTIDSPTKSYVSRYKDPVRMLCVVFISQLRLNTDPLVLQTSEDIVYSTWVEYETLKQIIPYLEL